MLASIGVSLLKSGAHVAAFGGFRVSFPLGAAWLALATGLAAGARAGRRAFPRAPENDAHMYAQLQVAWRQ